MTMCWTVMKEVLCLDYGKYFFSKPQLDEREEVEEEEENASEN